MIITVYTTIDHFRERKQFRTLAGATAYALRRMGTDCEISNTFQYAITSDGVGKMEVRGCSLETLLDKKPDNLTMLVDAPCELPLNDAEQEALNAEREREDDEHDFDG